MEVRLLVNFPAGAVASFLSLLDTIETQLKDNTVRFTLAVPDSDTQSFDLLAYEIWYKQKSPELWSQYLSCTASQRNKVKYDGVIFVTNKKLIERVEAQLAAFSAITNPSNLSSGVCYYNFYPMSLRGLGPNIRGLPKQQHCLHYYYANDEVLYSELKAAMQSLHIQW